MLSVRNLRKTVLFFTFALLAFMGALCIGQAYAAQVSLAWDANTESNLAGYRVYYRLGNSGAPYDGVGLDQGDSPITVPLDSFDDPQNPRVVLTGLVAGTYYFTCTAYNDNGDESGFANEVSYTVVVDELAPEIPTAIAAVALDANRMMVTWAPTTDNGGGDVAGYRVYRDGQPIGSTAETIFMDNGLLAATAYTYTIAAYDQADNTSAQSAGVTAQTLMESDLALRVNCGGGSYLDSAGHQWSADSGYNGGSTATISTPIARTQDDSLYQTERWDSDSAGNLVYRFKVPNGDYQVNLHFSDVYSGTQGTGLRVFDTLIEDQLRLDDLDIYAEVGADAALIRSFDVRVLDGELEIAFVSEVENAKISGIEILSKGFAAPVQYTLTATAGQGGSISPAGATSVTAGDSLGYTISPAAHYHIAGVYVDDTPVGSVASYRFDNVNADHSINAVFALDTVIVSASAGAGGSITPNGATTVTYGDSLSFQITPDAHYKIQDVRVNGESVGAVGNYTLADIHADMNVSASFAAVTHTITATAGAGGTIQPAGDTQVAWGQSLTYTITPEDHHHISDVMVNGNSVAATASYTFSNVDADARIAASFAIDTYTISAQAGDHGQISPTGQTTVAYGDSVTYTITPDDGYRVADVFVDDESQGALDTFAFTNLSGPHTIQASFQAVNQPPSADAGPDQQADEGQRVTLSAANSVDPDDGIKAYRWVQLSGDPVTLTGADTETPSFIAPDVDMNGMSLTFQVTVEDYAGLQDTDTAIVNVSWVNAPPVAVIGPNQTVLEGEDVILDGSNSSDPDDGIAAYSWAQTGGTAVALSDAHSAQPTFAAPDVGLDGDALTFQLTVRDTGGLQATATCVINVSWVNASPVADSGPDQVVAEGAVVVLDGSNSVDIDDGIATYRWTQLEGTPVELSDPSAIQPQFIAPDVDPQGARLVFQLTVTDADGLQGQATTIVNVSWQNQPPVANAGADQQVGEGGQVLLDASGSSDADDGIAAYQWRQVSGPTVTLSDAGAMQPSFTAPDVGSEGASLVFRLTVSDQAGLQSDDDCIVTVTWENQPPVAHAGPDQTVSEGARVTLDGRASSDADDGIDAYLWSQTGGRSVTLSNPTAVQPVFTVPADAQDQERFTFRLTVTDGGGLQDDAVCTITVDRAEPQDTTAPAVSISKPTSAASYATTADRLDLSGSAQDQSGVVSVTWQVDQGTSGRASGTTSWSVTDISLPLGTSRIRITAVDGAGNSGTATLTVTRNAAYDTEAPKLTLEQPTTGNFYFTKRSYLSLSGSASDNDKVSKVTWAYSNGDQGDADGTDTWSVARISLKKWFNIITITAIDPAGNTATKTLIVLRWAW